MSKNKKFITGIYNYCDYICEKCVFTSQCYLYWAENQAEESSTEEMDMDFEEFSELDSDFEAFDIDQDVEHPFDEEAEDEDEERTQQIIAPSFKIIEILDPIMDQITQLEQYPDRVQQAIELVLENYLLITVKFYRAVHQTTFEASDSLDEVEIYNYVDTEKTLLALKSFNWNMRAGLHILQIYFTQHSDEFLIAMDLSRQIEKRIDDDLLPATRIILQKYAHHLDDDDYL